MTIQTIYKCALCVCLAMVSCLFTPAHSRCDEHPAGKVEALETGFYYTIQNGDTLWDLSHHFFDSPWVWPDLWGKNQDISNPHWIYPGDRIRLYRRSGTGKSAADTSVFQTAGKENKTDIKESSFFFYPSIDTVGFVRKDPVKPSGTIFSVKEDKFMISIGDRVYVRSADGATQFQSGDRYTIFRTKTLEVNEDGYFGIQHYLVGLLEIIDVNSGFSVAKIVESYRHIEIDDLLMPYTPRSKKIALTDKKHGLEGKIVAAEEDQVVFADHTVVFVNKGHQNGVRKGQIYNAYYRKRAKPSPDQKPILLSPVNFGEFIVLHTEPTTATAVVTMAEKSIEPGTKFH